MWGPWGCEVRGAQEPDLVFYLGCAFGCAGSSQLITWLRPFGDFQLAITIPSVVQVFLSPSH